MNPNSVATCLESKGGQFPETTEIRRIQGIVAKLTSMRTEYLLCDKCPSPNLKLSRSGSTLTNLFWFLSCLTKGLTQSVPATVFIHPKSKIIMFFISSMDQQTSLTTGVLFTIKVDFGGYEDGLAVEAACTMYA